GGGLLRARLGGRVLLRLVLDDLDLEVLDLDLGVVLVVALLLGARGRRLGLRRGLGLGLGRGLARGLRGARRRRLGLVRLGGGRRRGRRALGRGRRLRRGRLG